MWQYCLADINDLRVPNSYTASKSLMLTFLTSFFVEEKTIFYLDSKNLENSGN